MGAILYVTSAFSLAVCTIDGQDNVILAVLLAAALLLLQRSRALLSGAAVGWGSGDQISAVGLCACVLCVCPATLAMDGRIVAVIGAVYGSCMLLRLPILVPLQIEGP